MMRRAKGLVMAWGIGLLLAWPARAGDQPAAEQVVQATGVSAGLAVVVGTTDGALEAGLTNQGRMLVQGLALSAAAAAKARQHIFEKTLYGLASVSVVKTAATLPYYDRLVNLLVADLDALGADGPAKDEIDRVLGYEGVAYLKRGGAWTRTVKPTPREIDRWSHYAYDASRNAVSKDRLVGPPNAVRWLCGPTGRNPIGGPRTSDGVFVQIGMPYNPRAMSGRPSGDPSHPWAPVDPSAAMLWARDVHSGVLLWYRTLNRLPARGYKRWTSYGVDFAETFVASGGRVYGFDFTQEHVALTAWNLRTGAVETVFDASRVFRKSEGSSGADGVAPAAQKKKSPTPEWLQQAHETFADSRVLVHGNRVVHLLRDRIYVMDAASGQVRWAKEFVPGTYGLLAWISSDRLLAISVEGSFESFYRNIEARYAALEAWRIEDGNPLWRFTDFNGMTFCDIDSRAVTFGCLGDDLLIPGKRKADYRLMLLNTRDGKRVWDVGAPGMTPVPGVAPCTWCIIGDRIWAAHRNAGVTFDRITGKTLSDLKFTNPGACAGGGGTTDFFIIKKYFMPTSQELTSGNLAQYYWLRTIGQTCGEKLCPSYGSVFALHPVCGCEMHLTGTVAYYPIRPTTPAPDAERRSSSGLSVLGPVPRQSEAWKHPGAFDWGKPDWLRSFMSRRRIESVRPPKPAGDVPAASPDSAPGAPMYSTRGGGPVLNWVGYGLTQTAPVQAGDLSLVAYVQEHRLAARRGDREVWNVVAGGRISSPPVVGQGRAFFGSHDGYVYAVNVQDGALAWRFLAAPADRRHVVFGQVESAWPVFNVVLHEGKLYGAAGRHSELDGGIHLYGLDPESGSVVWHVRHASGLSTEKDRPIESSWERIRVLNDPIEIRDGKIWIQEKDIVDLAHPRDTILNPESIVPPWLWPG
jgi:outer membrane protein assembly factor BamB